jgi:hypothetical protein
MGTDPAYMSIGEELGTVSNTFEQTAAPHASGLYKFNQ